MMQKLLIANRGEIACRVIATAKRLGVATVAVYSQVDERARHVELADEAWPIGPAPARDSYLCIDKIVDVAARAGADAVHPGYGFLSENPAFAEACCAAGLIFVGPSASAMRAIGSKAQAKELMARARAPVIPGYHGAAVDIATLRDAAERIGYPVMIKASAGGGGRGMRIVDTHAALEDAIRSAEREALAAFGEGRLLIEKYLPRARHVEVQIFADGQGGCVAFPERDCSMQRRHQKILEETPAPKLAPHLAQAMRRAALTAAQLAGYSGAGTVEFLVQDDAFYFLEMNARLQVEHPITEMIAGVDLVEWQLRVASGEALPRKQEDIEAAGCAIEVRVCAEIRRETFSPPSACFDASGRRRQSSRSASTPACAKAIFSHNITIRFSQSSSCSRPDRAGAIRRLRQALAKFELVGAASNLDLLHALSIDPAFTAGDYHTNYIETHMRDLLKDAVRDTKDEVFLLAAGAAAWRREMQSRSASEAERFGDRGSPWALADGWRLDSPCVASLDVALDGREIKLGLEDVSQSAFRLHAQGSTVLVEAQPGGDDITVFVDGVKRELVIVTDVDGGAAIIFAGRNHVFKVSDASRPPPPRAEQDFRLLAPLPARVSRIFVKAGEKVRQAAPVMMLEVMKTEFALNAPRDGTIESIFCREGDLVPEGAQLARLADETAECAP